MSNKSAGTLGFLGGTLYVFAPIIFRFPPNGWIAWYLLTTVLGMVVWGYIGYISPRVWEDVKKDAKALMDTDYSKTVKKALDSNSRLKTPEHYRK